MECLSIGYTTRLRSLRDIHYRGPQARGCVYPVETDTELYNQLVPWPLAFISEHLHAGPRLCLSLYHGPWLLLVNTCTANLTNIRINSQRCSVDFKTAKKWQTWPKKPTSYFGNKPKHYNKQVTSPPVPLSSRMSSTIYYHSARMPS